MAGAQCAPAKPVLPGVPSMDYTFHWRPVFRKLPDLLEAGLVTLEVAILAMLGLGFTEVMHIAWHR